MTEGVFEDRANLHDPGGRSLLAMPPDVRAHAVFSACGRYRQGLVLDWSLPLAPQEENTVLFIGMNPSQASHTVLDPTCARELGFSRRWGFTRMVKGNVLDLRCTDPSKLPDPAEACSTANIPFLSGAVGQASKVVLCFGRLHERYREIVRASLDAVLEACRETGITPECFGLNADGSAKHPLYLRSDTPTRPFPVP